MSNSAMAGWLIATARRRVVATTLIYAASLTIRSASGAGEEAIRLATRTAAPPPISSVTMTDTPVGNAPLRRADCRLLCVAAGARPSKLSCVP
ncbi:MAG: hypothetical protein ACOY6K_11445 [Pseudomonadota bacterium]